MVRTPFESGAAKRGAKILMVRTSFESGAAKRGAKVLKLGWWGLCLSVLFWLGIGSLPTTAQTRLRVVATLPDLAAITHAVGGEQVDVTSLAVDSQDPHHVDPRPHLVLALNRADLLIFAGLDLEIGWLPTLVRGARNARIQKHGPGNLDASTVVHLKDLPTGRVDRSQGDVHPAGNPHYLTDPRNGATVAEAIASKLGQLDRVNQRLYFERASILGASLRDLARSQEARFRALPAGRRRIVTHHRSLTYLVEWLGLDVVETLEPKPGIPPSPDHVAYVIALINREKVPAIVQEDYLPKRTAALVASKSGAKLVQLPGFPHFEKAQDYLGYIAEVADHLYAALER